MGFSGILWDWVELDGILWDSVEFGPMGPLKKKKRRPRQQVTVPSRFDFTSFEIRFALHYALWRLLQKRKTAKKDDQEPARTCSLIIVL